MLRSLSKDGHIDSVHISVGRRQGINKNDSVFRGFCKQHDEIFYPLDVCTWDDEAITPELHFLIALRSHAKEWYQSVTIEQRIPNLQDQHLLNPSEMAAKFEDHRRLRKFFCDNLKNRNYEAIKGSYRRINHYLPLAYTSPFLLEIGPTGVINDLINSVEKSITIAPLFLTIFPDSEGSTIVFFGHKRSQTNKYHFIESQWLKNSSIDFKRIINALIFCYGENLYVAPNYLTNEQVRLMVRFKLKELASKKLTPSPDTVDTPFSIFELRQSFPTIMRDS
jgi:hypothetical protein